MIQPFLLDNPIRHYQWGTHDGIASFLSRKVPDTTPCAEYWMGSHPAAPSLVCHDERTIALDELIASSPEVFLGKHTATLYDGRLPFLYKILSAARPLSLQVHPDKDQAEAGFDRENKAGIPLDSPVRNYRDANHKPELLTAVTPFRALCGFRDHAKSLALLSSCGTPLLQPAIALLANSRDYLAFYRYLLELPSIGRRELTESIATRAQQMRDTGVTGRAAGTDEYIQALDLAGELASIHPADVGCLSPFFMNIIDLEPGQSLYLYSGILHTYIRGTGMELMASSDNVLRGGLTDKHIDITEFLSVLDRRPYHPSVILPDTESGRRVIRTPARDFELSFIELDKGDCPLPAGRPSILLCTKGCFRFLLRGDSGTMIRGAEIAMGLSFFIPACVKAPVIEGRGICWLASVPPTGGEAE